MLFVLGKQRYFAVVVSHFQIYLLSVRYILIIAIVLSS